MQLVIETTGRVRTVYTDALDLRTLGRSKISRASTVEPDETGRWHADLRRLQGPVLGPFERRRDAVAAERRWLVEYWLSVPLPCRGTG